MNVYAPEPPIQSDHTEFLGMKRFVFRATFVFIFFGATAGFVRTEHLNGGHPSFWAILGVLSLYAAFALLQALWMERDIVLIKNRRLAEQYEKDLQLAQDAQPIRSLVRSAETGELEPVRAPLKAPRPLLDATLGKTSGKR